METPELYLVKSVIWISGFTLVYILFLRNERFFTLNRFFLLSGIIASFLMPLFTLHYDVALPLPSTEMYDTEGSLVNIVENPNDKFSFDTRFFLILLYLSGMITMVLILIRQNLPVIRSLIKTGIRNSPVKLIRTSDYSGSFSFFSWIFVNPSVSDIEIKEIMNHELVHIRQKHWVDLVLAGMLCTLQWFNPLAWKYLRLIRQNHEYMADEEALQQTSDPAVYRATLLNQIVGSPVISLANSFNYSLNKKRFEMMKNIITSPYRKLKVLLVLPVFAIVLYAFAKPDYRYDTSNISNNGSAPGSQQKTVKGTVIQNENGKPLERATIVVTGTTTGTSTDADGRFKLENVPDGGALAVSYVGYKSKVLKPEFTSEMIIRMELDTIKSGDLHIPVAPSSPPPPPPVPAEGPQPVAPVQNVTAPVEKDLFVVIEELPEFPGGTAAMASWINSNMKYPEEALKKKITGKVYVTFLIADNGKIKNVQVLRPVHPLLDAEAERVISNMPEWKPGTQSGKAVAVNYQVPVDFNIK